jgi:hypothetical protein
MWLSGYAPSFTVSIVGEFVWRVEYEFSGMKAPGLNLAPKIE